MGSQPQKISILQKPPSAWAFRFSSAQSLLTTRSATGHSALHIPQWRETKPGR
jgi:hypothetical protein